MFMRKKNYPKLIIKNTFKKIKSEFYFNKYISNFKKLKIYKNMNNQ